MRKLNIACGNRRTAKKWSNKTIEFDTLKKRLKNPVITTETVKEYQKLSKGEKDEAKDCGGFVAGVLKGGRRKNDTVESRSMIVLDADHATKEFLNDFEKNSSYCSVLYSTHSHTEENPRVRIILPLTRNVSPEEYAAVSRYVAATLGMDMFDECSYLPNQLMYWPSISADGIFVFKEVNRAWLNPDDILNAHPEWTDYTQLPTSSRESVAHSAEIKKVEDPLEKEGLIGVFNRCYYPINTALDEFLSDIYEPSDREDRYHLKESGSAAGVEIKEDGKFVYSHHAKDKAYLKLCNAFDIVRIHKFGDDDSKKSFNEMCTFISSLNKVKQKMFEEKQEEAGSDFKNEENGEWINNLVYKKLTGKLEDSLHNARLIIENDKNLKCICFNELGDGMEMTGEVPWKHPSRFWRDADDAQLINYIDKNYGYISKKHLDMAVTKVTDDRSYHPVHDMFDALPEWDGIERVETLIVDYLGAEDCPYIRAVTRKMFAAAYRRVYEPGIKFDYIGVLNGNQGIGKSTFIAAFGNPWYSDSLTMSDMNDKTAAEKVQGNWILEIGELAGMKKTDINKIKAFISRQDDKYRASFGRRVAPHPRQCVFWGTTNEDNGYLRDITGNRRFWNIRVSGRGKHSPWDITKETVEQTWAEVKARFTTESLFLSPELEAVAKEEQRAAMETDEREGIVRKYLDTLLPENWDEMTESERTVFLSEDFIADKKGTVEREYVSNIEIWCECFGRRKSDIKPKDSYDIAAIMSKFEEWEKTDLRKRIPLYGQQRLYKRKK